MIIVTKLLLPNYCCWLQTEVKSMIIGMVKDQGHKFLKLFWANFPKFLGSGYFASQGKIVFFFIKTNCLAKQVGLCFENY